MAANTRYEPAPQRDSFEERPYTQAPPSYEATADAPGTPRSEDDNLPDDFKVLLAYCHSEQEANSSSSAAQSQRERFRSGCSSSGKSTLYCKTRGTTTYSTTSVPTNRVQNGADPPHDHPQLGLLFQRQVPDLDPV